MRKLLSAALALTVIAAGCTHGASARSRVTELAGVDVDPGANKIAGFVADGRAGLITQGWRDLGGDRGYRIYSVMVPSMNPLRGWDIVAIEPAPDDASAGETPDIAGTVRFAHGYLDGEPATFLITAALADPGKPSKVGFELYRLVTARGSGGPENAFEPILHQTSRHNFCNPDLALAREFDLKLPRTYTGLNTVDGCPGGV